ncbi:hypothetical protein BT93_F0940 [Corymbia citriodora subsp. variegata]|nr:hypothetical protein BT93_F0940 [Corymbia citriodora subsp. variegata]
METLALFSFSSLCLCFSFYDSQCRPGKAPLKSLRFARSGGRSSRLRGDARESTGTAHDSRQREEAPGGSHQGATQTLELRLSFSQGPNLSDEWGLEGARHGALS